MELVAEIKILALATSGSKIAVPSFAAKSNRSGEWRGKKAPVTGPGSESDGPADVRRVAGM